MFLSSKGYDQIVTVVTFLHQTGPLALSTADVAQVHRKSVRGVGFFCFQHPFCNNDVDSSDM